MSFIPDEKKYCHRTGFNKKCRELVVEEKCWLWKGIVGTNHAGETVNEFGCVDAWKHEFMAQLVNTQNQAAASCDKAANETRGFRNDMRSMNGMPELSTQDHPLMISKEKG